MIPSQRHLFDIPRDVAYFNTAGASPLLNSVVEASRVGVQVKTHPWTIGANEFWNKLTTAREAFVKLFRAANSGLINASDVALVPSATYGVEVAVRNLKLNPGDEIVLQAEEFPALVLPLTRAAEKAGAKIIFVPRPEDFNWTPAFLKAITAKTKVIGFGLSHWTDGLTVNAEEIIVKAQQVNAELWLDACQSLGALPFKLNLENLDYIFAPTYKWLMGPYTFGFLYVHPKHQFGEPLEEYWASRMDSDDFSKLTHYETRYRGGAIRFDMSERSQFINVPMAIAALEQILAWDPAKIEKTLEIKTDRIADGALAKGYVVAPKEFRSAHFLGIKNPNGFSDNFKNSLDRNKIYVGYRGDWMRIAPHLFNDDQDIEKLIQYL